MSFARLSHFNVFLLIACFLALSLSGCAKKADGGSKVKSDTKTDSTAAKIDTIPEIPRYVLDSVALASQAISTRQYSDRLYKFINKAGALWKKHYYNVLKNGRDEYETKADFKKRVNQTLLNTNQILQDSLYSKYDNKTFKIKFVPKVSYNPDWQSAAFELSGISRIPTGEYRVNKIGYRNGAMLFCQGEPLFSHVYSYHTALKYHEFSGGFRLKLDVEKAKEIDIVNNPGIVECVFSLTSHMNSCVAQCRPGKVAFPSIKLHSARYILNNDTLKFWREGHGLKGDCVHMGTKVSDKPYTFKIDY